MVGWFHYFVLDAKLNIMDWNMWRKEAIYLLVDRKQGQKTERGLGQDAVPDFLSVNFTS